MSRSNHESTASIPPEPTEPAADESPDLEPNGIEVEEQTPDGGQTGVGAARAAVEVAADHEPEPEPPAPTPPSPPATDDDDPAPNSSGMS